MSSSIAGNDSFRNVQNVTAAGSNSAPKTLNVSKLVVNNLTSYAETINSINLLANVKPSLEGLPVTVYESSVVAPTYVAGINVANWDGSNTFTVVLPEATPGTVVVHLQAVQLTATGEAAFQCASGDAFETGSVMPSLDGSNLTFAVSTAGQTDLDFNPGAAGTDNQLSPGALIYFWCTKEGFWHVAENLARDVAVVNGSFTFG